MKQVFISPSCMKDQILKYCHDIRSSGHLGQDKTLSKLKKVDHWHGMSTDCKLYVKTCHICNRQKKVNKKEKADLGQHHSGVPFERIHMDILGPLPVSKLGNKYILVIIDQFTKWIECYPLSNQYAETIAKALMDSTISRFGCPLEIHTDQGKNVDGNLIRHLCDRLEISKTRTTAYIPASNGQVERYNRLLTQMIRCYIKKNLHNWDAYLQQLTGAIRSTENRQTGFTPNVMLFGRENVHPIGLVLGLNMAEKGEISEYVKNLRDTLVEVHSLSRTNIKRAQMRQKNYDVNINYRTYKVRDMVLKVDTARKIGISPTLKSPWKGPYIVLEVKSPVLYRIKNRKTIEIVHHDRLKLCNDREFPKWLRKLHSDIANSVESVDTEEEREEEVDLDVAWMFDEDMARGPDTAVRLSD